jgi:hypothetical protein
VKIPNCFGCPCSGVSLTTVIATNARMCNHPTQRTYSEALKAYVGSIVRDGSVLPAGCPLRREPLVLEALESETSEPH